MKFKNKIEGDTATFVETKKTYCDGCGFENQELYERKDNKMFCAFCASRKQKILKEPNKDYCSGCSFKTIPSDSRELIQRRDGHWFHARCAYHESFYNEIKEYKKISNKNWKKIIIFLILIAVTFLVLFWWKFVTFFIYLAKNN